jgi:hypothetical protein
VLGNERLAHNLRAIKVTDGNGAVLKGLGREQCLGVTVLGNHFLGHNPENLGPNLTNGVLAETN